MKTKILTTLQALERFVDLISETPKLDTVPTSLNFVADLQGLSIRVAWTDGAVFSATENGADELFNLAMRMRSAPDIQEAAKKLRAQLKAKKSKSKSTAKPKTKKKA